ncbi:MAG: hypothetical protein J0H89_04035 [Rhizobiales bacterium]|nr:hypothetical protein [Hyphomicrobiales bacterium]
MGKQDGQETRRDPGREVYFECVAIGRAVKVTAIDSQTGLEVSVMGPVTASQAGSYSDLRQLALQKLKRRLERE